MARFSCTVILVFALSLVVCSQGFRSISHVAAPRDVSDPEKRVIRIALTGGPGGGKSSALSYLKEELQQYGYDVYAAPELATILHLGGTHWIEDESYRVEYLTAQCLLQMQMEESFTRIALATGKPSILVCDRGIFDNKAFVSEEAWSRVLQGVSVKDETSLLMRYDAVVHMVTAAQGAEEYYKHGWTVDDSGKAVFRRENITEARALDKKMLSSWTAHPSLAVIDNSGSGFDEKLQAVRAAVLKVAPARKA